MGRSVRLGVLLSILCTLVACPEPKSKEPPPRRKAAVSAPKPEMRATLAMGAIEGRVVLAPHKKMPELSKLQYFATESAARLKLPEKCTPLRDKELRVVKEFKRGLSPILVTITGFTRAPQAAARTHAMSIEDCRLVPGFLAAHQGDILALTNKSESPFLPRFRGDAFLQTIISQQTRRIELKSLGFQRIGCAFGASCAGAYLVVLGHPVFAMTDNEGRFRMDNVPAGEDVVLHAWHPLFSESKRLIKANPHAVIRIEDVVLYPTEHARKNHPN
ncbi:MAG: hypothetical protein H6714_04080 [Myxococcales bacterium]|nr:hypothetical protein [Myxococcales bacterium]